VKGPSPKLTAKGAGMGRALEGGGQCAATPRLSAPGQKSTSVLSCSLGCVHRGLALSN
jgi:hypothetical protein